VEVADSGESPTGGQGKAPGDGISPLGPRQAGSTEGGKAGGLGSGEELKRVVP
jgi:hypothetical protein